MPLILNLSDSQHMVPKMFTHTTHVFSRQHQEKRPLSKPAHIRDISITSTTTSGDTSTSSAMSFASAQPSTLHPLPPLPPLPPLSPLSPLSPSNSPTSSEFPLSPASTTRRHSRPPNSPSSIARRSRDSRGRDFKNPLSLHPTFGPPPPRLSERPILPLQPPPAPAGAAVPTYPAIEAPKPLSGNRNTQWRLHHLTENLERNILNPAHDHSPRHTIHTSTPASMAGVATDYFTFKLPLPVRPELRSHWSASTIGSNDGESEESGHEDIGHDDDDDNENDNTQPQNSRGPTPGLTPSQTPSPPTTAVSDQPPRARHEEQEETWPFPRLRDDVAAPLSRNHSYYKRNTVSIPIPAATSSPDTFPFQPPPPHAIPESPQSRRPRIKTIDSVEEFIRRGGWKRRGIVFRPTEGRAAVAALVGD